MKAEGERIVGRFIAVGDMLLTVARTPWVTEIGCHGSRPSAQTSPSEPRNGGCSLQRRKEVLAERMKSATMADLTLKQALDPL